MTLNVVLLGTYPSLQADRLRNLLGPGYRISIVTEDTPPRQRDEVLAQAEVLVANRLDANIRLGDRLQLVQSPSAGLDGIDPTGVPEGAKLLAASGHGPAMAEYVMCAILRDALAFESMTTTFDTGTWHSGDFPHGPRHGELAERTVGLLGFGSVARAVAARAAAFGMHLRAFSRSRVQGSEIDRFCAFSGPSELAAFLDGLDYIVVTLPLTDETEGYVNAEFLAQLPSSSYLINVSRGAVVSESDLFVALRDGVIRGACIDVWYEYPNPTNDEPVPPSRFPFHQLDQVTMTPHCSGRTDATFERRWSEIAQNISQIAGELAETKS